MSATLIQQFDLLAGSLGGIAKLRELILSLAVRGKLVPQDPADEPASVLLQKIRAEKERLIAEGKVKKDKPLPTIGDAEKPHELPKDWEWVRLGQISSRIQYGYTASADHSIAQPKLLRITDIQDNKVDWDAVPGVQTAGQDLSSYYLEPGDLLIARTGGTIGKSFLVTSAPVESVFASYLIRISPIIGTNPEFLKVFASSSTYWKQLLAKSMGTGQPNVNGTSLSELAAPLPPLPEQSRIVAKVDELMALCDRLEAEQGQAARTQGHWVEAALAQLADSADADEFARHWQHLAQHFDTLFATPDSITQLEATLLQLAVRGKLVPQDTNDEPASTLLQKIRTEKDRLIAEGKIKKDKPLPPISDEEKPFELPEGWEWARMQDVFDVRDGTHDTPKYVDADGVPLITSRNFVDGSICFEDAKLISREDHYAIKKRSNVERGDILYSMIGGNIGNQVLVNTDREFSIKNVALFKYYSAQLTLPKYLDLFLKTVTLGLQSRAVGGAQPFVSLSLLRNIAFPLASPHEQSRIVAKLEALFALTAGLKVQLAKAQQMQALLADVLLETST